MKNIRCLLALLLAALACTAAQAQNFPTRTVKIIVAFSPGGGTDIVARLLGQKLTEMWGQQVIVENRAGASGTIGTELAARAAPDGYTLFMGTLGNLSVNKHLYPKMTVDPLKDFAPITKVVDVHFVMVVHPSVPARNVAEFIALAKAKPGQVTYASSGPGGAPHLAAESFKRMAGIDMPHIPYKASAQSFQDLLGGQVMMTMDSQIQALPYIRDGRLRALGVLGKTRSAQLPDVQTIGETLPGYELTNWFGLVAPAATPKDILAKISADVAKALENQELRDKITALSATVVGDTPEQFGATMRADSEKWARVIREANIKAD
ncbi:MAG: tripartite tricarboxylate transporter substrate binding protein [Proteobacteria bacterium]|nr:tripartite tricarboxylate transporter substrate binding protein [Pseudomonadota bacterium]